MLSWSPTSGILWNLTQSKVAIIVHSIHVVGRKLQIVRKGILKFQKAFHCVEIDFVLGSEYKCLIVLFAGNL